MATPEPLEPSRRLQSAAAAERGRLGRELSRLDERVERLGHELEEIETQREAIRRRLALLARLAHAPNENARERAADEPVVTAAPIAARPAQSTASVVAGARIREAAVRIAAAEGVARRPLHYQEWLGLLERNGVAVAGKDPAATLLTQLARSPLLRRAGARGFYELDPDAPMRLRERVCELRAELARPDGSVGTIEELAAERDRRRQLSRELARAERELEEALRLLEAGE